MNFSIFTVYTVFSNVIHLVYVRNQSKTITLLRYLFARGTNAIIVHVYKLA